MKNKHVVRSAFLVGILALAASGLVFAQTPVYSNRVAQQVVIGGLRVDAAYVLAQGGGIQSYSCPTPQQYATPDGASQGWACFDSTTGVWLLSALPPQQQAPAPVVVQQVIQQPVYQVPVYQPPVVYRYEVVQPTIIYRETPRVIYSAPAYYPRVVERGYSSSAIIGAATINAAGRIAAAVIYNSHNDHRNDRYDRNVHVVQNNGRRR